MGAAARGTGVPVALVAGMGVGVALGDGGEVGVGLLVGSTLVGRGVLVGKLTGVEVRAGVRDGARVDNPVLVAAGGGGVGLAAGAAHALNAMAAASVMISPPSFIQLIARPPQKVAKNVLLTTEDETSISPEGERCENRICAAVTGVLAWLAPRQDQARPYIAGWEPRSDSFDFGMHLCYR